MNMPLAQPFARAVILRIMLAFILMLALLVAASAKLMGGGWLLLTCGIPYLLIFLLHAASHLAVIVKSPYGKIPLWALVVVSHVLFIAGFVLQMDYSDAPLPHLALTNITWELMRWPPPLMGMSYPAAPAWIAQMGLLWNVLVLLPASICWPLLFYKGLYRKKQ